MKRLSLLAVPLLLVGLLAGCGGNDSSASAAGTSASTSTGSASTDESSPADGSGVSEFCNVLIGIFQQPQQGSSDADALKLLKSVAAQLEQVGAPAGMPEAAARALQNAIDTIKALPDDATRKEVSKAAADLSKQEKKDQAALAQYVQATCIPSSSPSTSPSD